MTGDRAPVLYAILVPVQQAQVEAWCWGNGCGKGLVGGIDLGVCAAIPCDQDVCPHVDRQMEEPWGEVDGRQVYLRKLKPLHDKKGDDDE